MVVLLCPIYISLMVSVAVVSSFPERMRMSCMTLGCLLTIGFPLRPAIETCIVGFLRGGVQGGG